MVVEKPEGYGFNPLSPCDFVLEVSLSKLLKPQLIAHKETMLERFEDVKGRKALNKKKPIFRSPERFCLARLHGVISVILHSRRFNTVN